MLPVRCLLLDDEPIARQVLRNYAERLPFLQIVGECANALEAYEFLRQHEIELIFCDIEMPQISGLDFLNALAQRPFVILTTAYEQYALVGYELDVIDYLLKPIAFDRFWRAIEKVKDRIAIKEQRQGNSMGLAVVEYTKVVIPLEAPTFIMVKVNGDLVKVTLNTISYIEAMRDYVKIYILGNCLVTYLTMKKMEESLPAEQFTRVHKSYIVRNDDIQALQGNILELKSKVQIPVGVQFREVVLRLLHEHFIKR